MSQTTELSEKVAKDALGNLDWPALKSHLDKVVLELGNFNVLLGHLRRTNTLIMAYPNPKRERQRETFLHHLQDYATEKLGQSAFQLIEEASLLNKIERGYRGILEILEKCDISKLPAEVRAAASIGCAAGQSQLVMKSLQDALSRPMKKRVLMQFDSWGL